MKIYIEKAIYPLTSPFFSLASPKGGEGRGEEVKCFQFKSPHPLSPRLEGDREPGDSVKMRPMRSNFIFNNPSGIF